MRSLLQSRNFRKNLYRWIGMYVAVILFFTSVVTYSKYMVGVASHENARVANFNVDISYEQTKDCLPGNDETCLIGVYRPTSKIPYYFTVDTTKIEVRTFLTLAINVNESFEIIEFAKMEEGKDSDYQIVNLDGLKEENKVKITDTLMPKEGKKIKYKIVVAYNGANIVTDENGNTYYEHGNEDISQIDKIVTLDYSAKQLTSN